MMDRFKNSNRKFDGLFLAILLICLMAVAGCKKFVEIEGPTTSISEANVYKTDATAIAAVTNVYTSISQNLLLEGVSGVSVLAGLSADELTLAGAVTDQRLLAYYKNELRTSVSENYGTVYWNGFFYQIFQCNAAIEGLNQSESLTPAIKSQLLGEAKFLRAFFYFYAVNLYGDMPVVLTTNPNVNAKLPRTSIDKVYEQIITDLKDAQELLASFFPDASLLKSTSERVRPTKWAATALLARTYLYLGQYANAEVEAGKVISNGIQFSLLPLNEVFLKNSSEAIWQLQPVETGRNTKEGMTFVLPPTGPNSGDNPVYLSTQMLNAFEPGDLRRKGGNWVDSVISGGNTYYYPAKYKAKTISGSSFTEYFMMFRLAEQYLIRAEARTQENNLEGAQDDLNAVRTRAGLPNVIANDQSALLAAIMKERQVELFTEMGQRWLDLKRTATVDAVMTQVTPLKANGSNWQTYQQLYPVPYSDIQKNVNLSQNPGY